MKNIIICVLSVTTLIFVLFVISYNIHGTIGEIILSSEPTLRDDYFFIMPTCSWVSFIVKNAECEEKKAEEILQSTDIVLSSVDGNGTYLSHEKFIINNKVYYLFYGDAYFVNDKPIVPAGRYFLSLKCDVSDKNPISSLGFSIWVKKKHVQAWYNSLKKNGIILVEDKGAGAGGEKKLKWILPTDTLNLINLKEP